MYIKSVKIVNYRNFRNFEMSFQKGLNVIIGANNAGKTNLLRAIELISIPEIKLDDFNKNDILEKYQTLYKTEAPKIEIEYQIYHEIDENSLDDESILKLIPFLGLDKIEEQKATSDTPTKYSIIAYINMRYSIDPKNIDKYKENIKHVDTLEKYINALGVTLKYYSWSFTNGTATECAEKKYVADIFRIDFIEAERNVQSVYKETRKTINDFIKSDENASKLQIMKETISAAMKTNINSVLSQIDNIITQEKNEIGLEKGNVAIAQDVCPTATISEYYTIDVKDSKTDYVVPLSHNGVGYNNLINIYMLIKLVEMKKEMDSRILCFEEPEAHLHPAMQYKLFSYLKRINDENKLNQQIFVSTHSSNITAVAGLDNMHIIDYNRDIHEVICRDIKEQFKCIPDAKKHMMKFLDVTKSDMLFASKVILVEGIAEKLLLPKFMDKLGCPYEDDHISIVEIGGKHFDHFLNFFANNPIEKKVLCITDKDYKLTDNNDELENISHYLDFVPPHVKKLNETFSNNNNIKIKHQTGLGKTFEDEMFITNYNKISCINGCRLLRIAMGETLHNFIDDNCLSFEKWNSNRDDIDGRSKEKIHKVLDVFYNAISKDPHHKDEYEKLFFANLFLSYAKDKKGDVALQILTNDNLINSIEVPEYIKEGLEWLLK